MSGGLHHLKSLDEERHAPEQCCWGADRRCARHPWGSCWRGTRLWHFHFHSTPKSKRECREWACAPPRTGFFPSTARLLAGTSFGFGSRILACILTMQCSESFAPSVILDHCATFFIQWLKCCLAYSTYILTFYILILTSITQPFHALSVAWLLHELACSVHEAILKLIILAFPNVLCTREFKPHFLTILFTRCKTWLQTSLFPFYGRKSTQKGFWKWSTN